MRITGPRKKSIFAGGTVVTARVVRTTLLMLAVGYVGFMARTVSDMANNGDADGGGGRGHDAGRKKARGRALPPASPTKTWGRTKFTLDMFLVAGVNLGQYEMDGLGGAMQRADAHGAVSFELYEDFDIADQITGNEGWWDLVKYRHDLKRPSLSFYVDKIAQRRWMHKATGISITAPLVLKYKFELTDSNERDDEEKAIMRLLPEEGSYVSKPTHKSCSSGVWLVKLRGEDDSPLVAQGGHTLEEDHHWHHGREMSEELAEALNEQAGDFESWALIHVRPGLAIEERYTADGDDDRPAMEFKIFVIWGRVWLANWRKGSHRWGLIYRDGTVVDWSGYDEDHPTVPDFVDWDRVIEIAETLGANKDMYRVDIFVGVPAGLVPHDATEAEQHAATRVVVSETELHPTTTLKDEGLFEEAARLWIAGYRMGNYKVATNDEVPKAFLSKGYLTEFDVEEMTAV
mmetsp:Transcript_17769/g.32157  ORF Transcript_17769/g.32157 Transcript_17769/m.32157 type:complete len:460 (-) Transcript_17769:302-1681(-)|eukprot:CAMPEP_0198292840 /NCGR_PEP_ID=MMETSP1449-20131203/14283_1 /TAXON_ID=420275 /ORGANISM="Attheya septentrionalis, Strain CCMP2084" /LENGTH=459 /DNA_ID=CAMNT_0043992163 /DNA_START=136 /DNA_END=1515 /DNA_ORIENTATION=-